MLHFQSSLEELNPESTYLYVMGLGRLLTEEELKKLAVFEILDWATGGECFEHKGMGSVLVKDYAYVYPGRELMVHKMSIGWVCAGCIERGYTILDCGAVKIVPVTRLQEERTQSLE